jgi:hypothetical protein
MGWGDEIMAAGRAREARKVNPFPVAVLNRHGKPRWHEAWRASPHILHPTQVEQGPYQCIIDGPRARPYVDTTDRDRWVFKPGKQTRGDLYLDAQELAMAPHGSYVVLQPHSKPSVPGKAWGWARWQALADLLPWRLVQPGLADWPTLEGAQRVVTSTFRQAAGVIAGARMVITPEGAMHHAAAALGVPAVVLYGGFITSEITGYPEQVAIVDDGPGTPCGVVRQACPHCVAAWARIYPEQVAEQAMQLMEASDARGTAAA